MGDQRCGVREGREVMDGLEGEIGTVRVRSVVYESADCEAIGGDSVMDFGFGVSHTGIAFYSSSQIS